MKRCTFLFRGINVGGHNRVVMEKFCHDLEKLGFKNVSSFINSGIFFFDSLMKEELLLAIEEFLNKSYAFINVFSLFTLEEYQMSVNIYRNGGKMICTEKMSSFIQFN